MRDIFLQSNVRSQLPNGGNALTKVKHCEYGPGKTFKAHGYVIRFNY